jgi:digeranylgeranylglycerophospholipid reductase
VLTRRGLRVRVLERKQDPGERLHTTGIIVKEVVDQIALLDAMPAELVRQIPGVRLYAPNMRFVDLEAPGYYFLATDTPNVLRWLAAVAQQAGVELVCGASFTGAIKIRGGYQVEGMGDTRYLVGADGPNSQVARSLALGQNRKFLFGMEYEFSSTQLAVDDRLHCFIDRKLAPGYIGWMVPGVGCTQIGLARRLAHDPDAMKRVMEKFLDKIVGVLDVRGREPASIRAGVIPCGGVVQPVTTERALLVGDAAGMVSPVTAGGIQARYRRIPRRQMRRPAPLVRRHLPQIPHQTPPAPAIRLFPKRLVLQLNARFQTDANGGEPGLFSSARSDEEVGNYVIGTKLWQYLVVVERGGWVSSGVTGKGIGH